MLFTSPVIGYSHVMWKIVFPFQFSKILFYQIVWKTPHFERKNFQSSFQSFLGCNFKLGIKQVNGNGASDCLKLDTALQLTSQPLL